MSPKKAAVSSAQQQQAQVAPKAPDKKQAGAFFGSPPETTGTFLGANSTNPNLTRARFLGA